MNAGPVADGELDLVAVGHVEGASLLRTAAIIREEKRSTKDRPAIGIGRGERRLEKPGLVLSGSLLFLIVDQEGGDDPVVAHSAHLAAYDDTLLRFVRHKRTESPLREPSRERSACGVATPRATGTVSRLGLQGDPLVTTPAGIDLDLSGLSGNAERHSQRGWEEGGARWSGDVRRSLLGLCRSLYGEPVLLPVELTRLGPSPTRGEHADEVVLPDRGVGDELFVLA
jgi:hypothetical protein